MKPGDATIYFFLRFLLLISRVFPDSFTYRLGEIFGWLIFRFSPRKRGIVAENLKQALGENQFKPEMVRTNLMRLGRTLGEFLLLPGWREKKFAEKVEFSGLDILKQAYAENKGVILAGGHIGNWELKIISIGKKGYPVHAIIKEQKLPRTDKLINQLRENLGLGLIYQKGLALREAFQVLRRGEVLLVMMDEFAGARGVEVDFCGRKTPTFSGAAVLSRKFSCPVLPVAIRYLPNDRHRVVIKEPVPTEGRTVPEILEDLNEHLGEEIRNEPAAWLALRPRWRERRAKAVSS